MILVGPHKLTERPSSGNQPKQAGIVYWSNWWRAHHQNCWQIPVISSKETARSVGWMSRNFIRLSTASKYSPKTTSRSRASISGDNLSTCEFDWWKRWKTVVNGHSGKLIRPSLGCRSASKFVIIPQWGDHQRFYRCEGQQVKSN